MQAAGSAADQEVQEAALDSADAALLLPDYDPEPLFGSHVPRQEADYDEVRLIGGRIHHGRR
jgi:hypothetical protein